MSTISLYSSSTCLSSRLHDASLQNIFPSSLAPTSLTHLKLQQKQQQAQQAQKNETYSTPMTSTNLHALDIGLYGNMTIRPKYQQENKQTTFDILTLQDRGKKK